MSGVVRDAGGAPQMGVLVQVLHDGVVASAFTDPHGHFQVEQLRPGVYDLETSAALFLPMLRRHLRVQGGAVSHVTLTLSGLLDESGLLTAPGRAGVRDSEDWKWTLRSPANRPMLRLVDDQESAVLPIEEEHTSRAGSHRGIVRTSASGGGFGNDGVQVRLETARQEINSHRIQALEVGVGDAFGPGEARPISMLIASTTGRGQTAGQKLVASLETFPQIVTAQGVGLEVLKIRSQQRMEIGSLGALSVGGTTQMLHSGGTLLVVQPYVELSVNPVSTWVVHYRFDAGGRDAITSQAHGELTGAPTLVRQSDSRLATPSGTRQELSLSRSGSRVRIQVALSREAQQTVSLAGQLLHRSAAPNSAGLTNIAFDTANGSFQTLAKGFTGFGGSATLDASLGSIGSLTAAYLNGIGLDSGTASPSAFVPGMTARRSSALCVRVQRFVPKAGSELSVGYRWQAAPVKTTVAPYTLPDVSPYLSVHLAQRLPLHSATGSTRTELTVDGTNLLAEGYKQDAEEPGAGALLTSEYRQLRAGIAVTF